jgi:hypothetical protein
MLAPFRQKKEAKKATVFELISTFLMQIRCKFNEQFGWVYENKM